MVTGLGLRSRLVPSNPQQFVRIHQSQSPNPHDGSTQFTGDFSVNTQSQNGQPNGSLVAVDIADDGLVTASYSNGTQDLKGKIVLATFSTPNGLRQLGDSTFLESNESGAPTLGEPGGAGFGTIRAGARERANVDLTSELVDLITAQRNFQANAGS